MRAQNPSRGRVGALSDMSMAAAHSRIASASGSGRALPAGSRRSSSALQIFGRLVASALALRVACWRPVHRARASRPVMRTALLLRLGERNPQPPTPRRYRCSSDAQAFGCTSALPRERSSPLGGRPGAWSSSFSIATPPPAWTPPSADERQSAATLASRARGGVSLTRAATPLVLLRRGRVVRCSCGSGSGERVVGIASLLVIDLSGTLCRPDIRLRMVTRASRIGHAVGVPG